MTYIIWMITILIYGLFWIWYVGLKKIITKEEVDECIQQLRSNTNDDISESRLAAFRHFFENDDGKEFVMVNLIHFKDPISESRKGLAKYQKIFLSELLRKAGHPIMLGKAASTNIENVNCQHADNWNGFGMIRYRSRRDLMEIIKVTAGSEHHELKLASLEKTLAFPSSPFTMMVHPKYSVFLLLSLIACVVQIITA